MRILTDLTKAELDNLTSQPTAKKMIEKVKTEGKYIAEGDAQGAAEFVAMRKQQKQDASLQISEEGLAALEKERITKESEKEKDTSDQETQIKEKIAELKKELAELKSKRTNSEKAKEAQEKKANAIAQQISVLSMQLLQLQKAKTESSQV